MKHVWLTLFAIGLAGIAAMAATTAMLNAPVRPAHIGTPKSDQPTNPSAPTIPPPGQTPAPAPGTPPELPPSSPPTSPPTSPPASPAPSGGNAPAPAPVEEEGEDKDPYEGIAPEELPPDLQYDADSSVSFPTNI